MRRPSSRRNAPKTSRPKRNRPPKGARPGEVFSCGDDLVGRKVSGYDYSGTVLGCAVPPEGKRGPHVVVGTLARASTVRATSRARARRQFARTHGAGSLDTPRVRPLGYGAGTADPVRVIAPPPPAEGDAGYTFSLDGYSDREVAELTRRMAERMAFVHGVESARAWTERPGKERVYADLVSLNGGKGTIGASIVWDVRANDWEFNGGRQWSGAKTREWHYANLTMGRMKRVAEQEEKAMRPTLAPPVPVAMELPLAALTGSPKQVSWAEDIREEMLRRIANRADLRDGFLELPITTDRFLRGATNAKWFIDNRAAPLYKLSQEAGRVFMERADDPATLGVALADEWARSYVEREVKRSTLGGYMAPERYSLSHAFEGWWDITDKARRGDEPAAWAVAESLLREGLAAAGIKVRGMKG